MIEAETAQAMELVRALCEKAREMSRRLARLEREGAANRDAPREIAELRCDISHAQVLIDRLQRKYLIGDNHRAQRHPTGSPSQIARRELAAAHRSGAG